MLQVNIIFRLKVFFFFFDNFLLKQIDINTANKLLTHIIIMLQLILLILIG